MYGSSGVSAAHRGSIGGAAPGQYIHMVDPDSRTGRPGGKRTAVPIKQCGPIRAAHSISMTTDPGYSG